MALLDDIRTRYGLPSDQEILRGLERGETLPAEFYFAPEIQDLEQERIFSKSWQYACHESKVAKPGDYAVTTAGNIPIIITHGRDGEVRGFVNVCRHRLHAIATEDGNKPLLQCPYHGWTYGLDGRLTSAPRSERESGFDCSSRSLIPVAVERWDQWIFVNPDTGATPLAEVTRDIRARTDELNTDLREYEFQVRYEYTMDCNWKVWAENAVECYHCPTLHRSSFGRTYDTGPDDYSVAAQDRDRTIWNSGPIKWLPGDAEPERLKGFRFAFTFPSSFFALDDYVGFVGSVLPLSPERCWAFVDMYAKPGADEDIVKAWLEMWDQTLVEDKRATDCQQIGYRSARVRNGRLMLDSEHPLRAFMKATFTALSA
ncbi:aromatic ring-hydroxylating oxygenase subunit alpha [Streptomyces iranensis]|uniref:Choline monooxygenase n=1 Tax=Streptomyces iranensis TaxID=576784 RepID=A0A060ZSR4_9ACTN|nr:aromatic ring-hydroxylating dioxygenase subunit alpha [Streptomyces iranensis]MBP2060970.1 choline monooxygenase [Streptomyces iranensis]CDR06441.1 Rieske (2Fe-2S) iron-sulfur domain-containingprotein [Streptomyces iranensis]